MKPLFPMSWGGIDDIALKSPSFLEGTGIEIGREGHPPSALLYSGAVGGQESAFPALRVCGGECAAPEGSSTPAPERRGQPCSGTHLPGGRKRSLCVCSHYLLGLGWDTDTPRVGQRGRRLVAEMPIVCRVSLILLTAPIVLLFTPFTVNPG